MEEVRSTLIISIDFTLFYNNRGEMREDEQIRTQFPKLRNQRVCFIIRDVIKDIIDSMDSIKVPTMGGSSTRRIFQRIIPRPLYSPTGEPRNVSVAEKRGNRLSATISADADLSRFDGRRRRIGVARSEGVRRKVAT